jgi:hypothetical protein
MSRRWLLLISILAMAGPLTIVTAGGQGGIPRRAASWAPEGWNMPRTPWGHPDLQGVWSGGLTSFDSLTPLERPDPSDGDFGGHTRSSSVVSPLVREAFAGKRFLELWRSVITQATTR